MKNNKKRFVHDFLIRLLVFLILYPSALISILNAHPGDKTMLVHDFIGPVENFKAPYTSQRVMDSVKKNNAATVLNTQDVFFRSILANQGPAVVMLCIPGDPCIASMNEVCNRFKIPFFLVEVPGNLWIKSWIAAQLKVNAPETPCFLFFIGRELLLPLNQGSLTPDNLASLITTKFKLQVQN